MLVVPDQEALHARGLVQQVAFHPRTARPVVPARHRCCAAHDDASTAVDTPDHRVADRPCRVVVVDVDPRWGSRGQRVLEASRFVVDGEVVAELVPAKLPLPGPARDADGAASGNLRDLADRRSNCARGRGHDDGVPRPRPADGCQREVGGDAVYAQDAQRQGPGKIGLPHLASDRAAVGDGIFLPAEHSHDDVAFGVSRVSRGHHRAAGEGTHWRADGHGLGVVRHGVHPAAHRRIDRKEFVANQQFAGLQLRQRHGDNAEMVRLRDPNGTRRQLDLAVVGRQHDR